MKELACFDVACNDPDNGLFAGRAHMISYVQWDGDHCELEADDWRGYAFTELPGAIRIHRRAFFVVGSKDWVGNWCWNRYRLPRAEAKRLIGVLRGSGRWRCTHGPSAWYEWFNREGRFAPPATASIAA